MILPPLGGVFSSRPIDETLTQVKSMSPASKPSSAV